MSPVAMCGTPYVEAIFFACVPFPDPCGPRTTTFTSAKEAFVVAHHHLGLHLPHRVERDADDDQHRGASERAARRLREAEVLDEEARRHCDGREEERAWQRQPLQDAVEIRGRRRAGPNA